MTTHGSASSNRFVLSPGGSQRSRAGVSRAALSPEPPGVLSPGCWGLRELLGLWLCRSPLCLCGHIASTPPSASAPLWSFLRTLMGLRTHLSSGQRLRLVILNLIMSQTPFLQIRCPDRVQVSPGTRSGYTRWHRGPVGLCVSSVQPPTATAQPHQQGPRCPRLPHGHTPIGRLVPSGRPLTVVCLPVPSS